MSERYDDDVEWAIDILLDPDLTDEALAQFREEYYQHGSMGREMSEAPDHDEIRLCALRLLVSYTEHDLYAQGPTIGHIIQRRIDG